MILVLALLVSVKPAVADIDSASMLQAHDEGLSRVDDAHQGAPLESMPHVVDASAHSFAGLRGQSDGKRQSQEQGDDSTDNIWVRSFAGQDILEKELMANSTLGEGPGVMRMLSSADDAREGDHGHNGKGHKTVWIPAQARSGSTLLMDMLSVPVTFGKGSRPGNMDGKFVLFEPCHLGDYVNGTIWWEGMENRGQACARTIDLLAKCDFSKIVRLSGWDRNQSQGLPDGKYNKDASSDACRKANLVLFKTVFRPPEGASWVLKRLNKVPSLMAVQNVRDPRGVMSSQRHNFGWSDGLEKICKYYASLVGRSHPRLLVIKFEDMIRNPWNTMNKMYHFLGLEFGKSQNGWIWNRFGKTNAGGEATCDRGKGMDKDFSTCTRNISNVVNRWKEHLTEEDLRAWSSPPCRRVADAFGYE